MTSTHESKHETSQTSAPPRWLPLSAVAMTLVLWASAFVAIRHLADVFSPGPLSLGRLVAGSITLAVALAARRAWTWPTKAQWPPLIAIGVLWFGVYNVALNAGEQRVDAGTAALLIQLSPILIAVLALIFLNERPTVWLGIGIVLAFAGVAIIAYSSTRGSGGHHDLLGVGLCLLSALVYSISLVLQKPLVSALSALQVTWVACTVGAVACLPFAPQLVRQIGAGSAADLGWLVYLGVFPTALAFTTFAYALRQMTAGSLGVTTYLVPPITVVLSLVFLGETPPPVTYIGGVLALVGVGIARRKPHAGPAQPA